MDELLKRLLASPGPRESRTYRVLILAEKDETFGILDQMQEANVVLRPIENGEFEVVKARRGASGGIISAYVMHALFGI